jgi:outer membrane protein assembly factor BamB
MTTLQDLPIEMLEKVLLGSCVLKVLDCWESSAYIATGSMYCELAKVWSEWWFRITGYWFTLTLKRRLRQRDPTIKYLPEPRLLHHINMEMSVWGLAKLCKELFVTSIFRASVYVYDTDSYMQTRTIYSDDLCNPRDIAASAIQPCLYVMEVLGAPERLLCLDPRTGTTVFKREIHEEGRNLAVDQKSGNVFLTCASKIVEYTSRGDLVRTVPLSSDMDMAWQAIPLSNGSFIVCQGWDHSAHHRVCMLTEDGNIAEFSHGIGEAALCDPVHASLDAANCVVVADSGNNRVCLLSPRRLIWLRNLTANVHWGSGLSLQEPYRALIEPDTGRLYIGSNNGHILVLQVQR